MASSLRQKGSVKQHAGRVSVRVFGMQRRAAGFIV
jgi:hypothetical protein